jgi:ribonuclease HII
MPENTLFYFFSKGVEDTSPAHGHGIAKSTVAELRQKYLEKGVIPSREVFEEFKADYRRGVRQICRVIERREAVRKEKKKRCGQLLKLEESLRAKGYQMIAGVDESGVGAVAGPVVAAAVVFPPGVKILGVDDSKRLDEKTRQNLAVEINRRAIGVGIGIAEVEEIDRINVYQASLQAFKRAVSNLSMKPDYLLVDARVVPQTKIRQECFVKGDSRHFSIAAASILAKTSRDTLMVNLDSLHPGYGLATHKGYATPQHLEAIRRMGPSPMHRTSYECINELTGKCTGMFYRLKDSFSGARSQERLSEWRQEFLESRSQLRVEEIRKLQTLFRRKSER